MKRLALFLLGFGFCVALASEGQSQNKVRTTVGPDVIDKVLEGLDVKFQRKETKEKDTFIIQYDFQRGDQPCRLFNYGGNDLWLECHFDKSLKIEDVNRWNASAKFSRAVLLDQKDKTVVSLEAQIDCLGGVTDAMIKQFVSRFDEEAKKFVKTLPK